MKITEKYFMRFECCEAEMSTEMRITKKEFEKQLNFLKKQVIETKDYDTPMIMNEFNYDYNNFISIVYMFDVATGSTILKKYKCKDGFVFREK